MLNRRQMLAASASTCASAWAVASPADDGPPITEEELKRALDPREMTEPGIPGKD